MSSTYTEAHRSSYVRYRAESLTRMSLYYEENKETIKLKRRERHAKQKIQRLERLTKLVN